MAHKIYLIPALITLCISASSGEIVLKNKQTIKCHGPYVVEGKILKYWDEKGAQFSIPLKIVDLEKSTPEDIQKPEIEKTQPTIKKKTAFYDMAMSNKKGSQHDNNNISIENRALEGVRPTNYTSTTSDNWNSYPHYIRVGISENNIDTIKKGLNKGEAPTGGHWKGYNGGSALHYAVVNEADRALRQLIKWGVDPNSPNQEGQTPLHLALERYRKKHYSSHKTMVNIIALLIEEGADFKKTDAEGTTPMSLMAASGDTTFLVAMKKRLHLDEIDSQGNTLIHYTSRVGDPKTTKFLLDNGANVKIKDGKGDTPFHLIIRQGFFELVEQMRGLGASITDPDSEGVEPFKRALTATEPTLAHYMLTDEEAKSFIRNDPHYLGLAVSTNRVDMANYILKRGGNPDTVFAGNPILIIAARHGNVEMVKVLLNYGADPNAKGDAGKTAYLEAAGGEKEKIKTVLRKAFSSIK